MIVDIELLSDVAVQDLLRFEEAERNRMVEFYRRDMLTPWQIEEEDEIRRADKAWAFKEAAIRRILSSKYELIIN